MDNYDTIISAAILANFFTWYFKPLDFLREKVVNWWIKLCIKWNMFWATKAINIITCPKCLAFWGILLYTFNLQDAIIASILALTLKKFIHYVESESKE